MTGVSWKITTRRASCCGVGSALKSRGRGVPSDWGSVLRSAPEFRPILGSFLTKLSPVSPQLLKDGRFFPYKQGQLEFPGDFGDLSELDTLTKFTNFLSQSFRLLRIEVETGRLAFF